MQNARKRHIHPDSLNIVCVSSLASLAIPKKMCVTKYVAFRCAWERERLSTNSLSIAHSRSGRLLSMLLAVHEAFKIVRSPVPSKRHFLLLISIHSKILCSWVAVASGFYLSCLYRACMNVNNTVAHTNVCVSFLERTLSVLRVKKTTKTLISSKHSPHYNLSHGC